MASVLDPDTTVAEVRRANGGYIIVDMDPTDTLAVHTMLAASSVFFAEGDDVKGKAKGTSKFGYKVRFDAVQHVPVLCLTMCQCCAWPIMSILILPYFCTTTTLDATTKLQCELVSQSDRLAPSPAYTLRSSLCMVSVLPSRREFSSDSLDLRVDPLRVLPRVRRLRQRR